MLAANLVLPVPPQAHRRLGVGMALSALVHLALIVGMQPMVAPHAPARPLEVRIQRVSPAPNTSTLFSTPAVSDVTTAVPGGAEPPARLEPGSTVAAAGKTERPR